MEMRTIFNICDYGAVGDGKTDCSRAIQTALNLAAECMGEVVVPPGVYKTGQVKMGPNTKLSGTSAWLFRDFGGSVFELNDPDATCMIDITGAFGCHINGMSLCGCDLGKNVHGVYLSWPVYNGGSKEDTPTLDDCKIGRFSGDGVHLHHIWCYSVRHCMFCFNGGAGLYMDGWDGFVIDNWFSANRSGGLLGGACTASVTATGNRVEWNRVGGFVIPSGSCLNITGNYFDRSGGPALRLGTESSGVRDLTITGNIFYRSGKQPCILTKCRQYGAVRQYVPRGQRRRRCRRLESILWSSRQALYIRDLPGQRHARILPAPDDSLGHAGDQCNRGQYRFSRKPYK